MYSTFLRKIYPDMVKHLDDNFMDMANSVIIKNTKDSLYGIGLIFRESKIDQNLLRSFFRSYTAHETNNIKSLIEMSILPENAKRGRAVVVLGIPYREIHKDRIWLWVSENDAVNNKFNVNKNEDPNLRLAEIRIDYNISEDRFIGYKEYRQHKDDVALYTNTTYSLDEEEKKQVVHTQTCFHDYEGASKFIDVDNILERIPADTFKFQSYARSDGNTNGLYVETKHRK
jgi:hypothetical protein